jgi:hypothetical protein
VERHERYQWCKSGNPIGAARRLSEASPTRGASSDPGPLQEGNDVWELTADTITGTAINLAVPNGETDGFPDQNIDWVLFTAIDANEHVVDAGGGII